MSMVNQAAVDALCSATYLENYIDSVENLPSDIQRIVSQLRELDSITNEIVVDIVRHKETYARLDDPNKRKSTVLQLQRSLVRMQEIGDQKLSLVAEIIERVENKSRQLEQNLENLDPGSAPGIREEEPPSPLPSSNKQATLTLDTPSAAVSAIKTSKLEDKLDSAKGKRHRRQRLNQETPIKDDLDKKDDDEKPQRKKKSRREKGNDKSPNNKVDIDPNEPTYCICQQVSYGEMIGCDNDQCIVEWFHFNCVDLAHKPKGKWFCPQCRGDRPNVMNPNLVEQLRKASKRND